VKYGEWMDILKSGHQTIVEIVSSCFPSTRHCPVLKSHLWGCVSIKLDIKEEGERGRRRTAGHACLDLLRKLFGVMNRM